MDERFYEAHAARVYGAALTASGDRRTALRAAHDALAGGDEAGSDGDEMVVAALLSASRAGRRGPFAHIDARDRDAVVLARLGGCSLERIATALSTDVADIKGRLTRALSGSSAQPAPTRLRAFVPRRRRPRRDFGSAVSPARVARAS